MTKNLLKEGYKPADISRALDISRSNCYISVQSLVNQKSEDFHIVKHIKAIAAQHPFWGYRRITAWLKHREGELINHKKVYRLMKEHKLPIRVCDLCLVRRILWRSLTRQIELHRRESQNPKDQESGGV